MKILEIAFKDLRTSFRSTFALVFMFGIPLLVTGIFVLMFGSGGDEAFELPTTRVQVLNMDKGAGEGLGGLNIGEILVDVLESEELEDLFILSEATDIKSAREAILNQEADVALIIPEKFTAAIFDPQGEAKASVVLYQDPTLTIGPGIIKGVVGGFLDAFSGTRIALAVTRMQFFLSNLLLRGEQEQALVQTYMDWISAQGGAMRTREVLSIEPPPGEKQANTGVTSMIALIELGMMIIYAFFTGTAAAQSILTEEEEGTLPRLFSTPTRVSEILSGKYLASALTILIQVIVLVLFGRLVFGINFGPLPWVALATVGLVAAATTFGIFVMSWLKDTRQAGIVFGGVVTLTGMLGVSKIFTGQVPTTSPVMEYLPLVVPQGWAMRLWRDVGSGADPGRLWLAFGALLVWSGLFFVVGRARFRRRYV